MRGCLSFGVSSQVQADARAHNQRERKLKPGVYLRVVSLQLLHGMTIRFSLLEKQIGKNEVCIFLFLRAELMYYSRLSILGISTAFLLSSDSQAGSL
jgi:hypothetical protein